MCRYTHSSMRSLRLMFSLHSLNVQLPLTRSTVCTQCSAILTLSVLNGCNAFLNGLVSVGREGESGLGVAMMHQVVQHQTMHTCLPWTLTTRGTMFLYRVPNLLVHLLATTTMFRTHTPMQDKQFCYMLLVIPLN